MLFSIKSITSQPHKVSEKLLISPKLSCLSCHLFIEDDEEGAEEEEFEEDDDDDDDDQPGLKDGKRL